MTSQAPLVNYEILDANGDPVSGGKLHTYAAGTTNNLTTWQDSAHTTPNTNPIVAGADGICAVHIYMSDAAYKFVEKDASDNTLRTRDNLYPNLTAENTLPTRVPQIVTTPLDHSATGDGVANDATAIQAALDAAEAAGTRVVSGVGLTYKSNSALALHSNLTLEDIALDFAGNSAASCLQARGEKGSAVTLTSNASVGDTTLTVTSISGLSAGDYLILYDGASAAELVRVESAAGSTINLTGAIRAGYTTANNASYKKFTPIDDVTLRNVTITCSTAVAGSQVAVLFDTCTRVRLENVKIIAPDAYGVVLAYCADVVARGCTVQENTAAIGYEVDICRDVLLDDCAGLELSIGVNVSNTYISPTAGNCVGVMVSRCRFAGLTTAVTLASAIGCGVFDCESNGGRIIVSGAECGVRRNKIFDSSSYGIAIATGTGSTWDDRAWGIAVTDNEIVGAVNGDGITVSIGSAVNLGEVVIARNFIHDMRGGDVGIDIDISGACTIEHFLVEGNRIGSLNDTTNAGCAFGITVLTGAGDIFTRLAIKDNVIIDTTDEAIYVTANSATGEITQLDIVGNQIATDALATNAIVIDDEGYRTIEATRIEGNEIVGSSNDGILLTSVYRCTVERNLIQGCVKGIHWDVDDKSLMEHVKICDNTFRACTNGIYITSDLAGSYLDYLEISGNRLFDCTQDSIYAATRLRFATVANNFIEMGNVAYDAISINGTSGDADDIVVEGNTVVHGGTGNSIQIEDAATVKVANNKVSGGADGIEVVDCDFVDIVANQIRDVATYGISVNGDGNAHTGLTIKGNHIEDADGDCIYVLNLTNALTGFSICNNFIRDMAANKDAISLQGVLDNGLIAHNYLDASAGDDAISVAGTAADNASDIEIHGNICQGNIEITNGLRVTERDNVYLSGIPSGATLFCLSEQTARVDVSAAEIILLEAGKQILPATAGIWNKVTGGFIELTYSGAQYTEPSAPDDIKLNYGVGGASASLSMDGTTAVCAAGNSVTQIPIVTDGVGDLKSSYINKAIVLENISNNYGNAGGTAQGTLTVTLHYIPIVIAA
jgi:parallel beta-helix repeat protein